MLHTEHIIENISDIKRFILSGNAVFTIEGNARFTYKVVKKEFDTKTLYFVSVLNGANNNSDYRYLGTIYANDMKLRFNLTAKSKISDKAMSYIAFNFLVQCLNTNKLHKDMTFYHNGCCGRCGRLLTVPESILSGLGPTCANKA